MQQDDLITAEKAELRRRMMALRDALPAARRAAGAARLAARADDPAFRAMLPARGTVIAGYLAMRSELDPGALMARLAAEGFALALPRITAEGLIFHHWRPGAPLAKGPFGTSEPEATSPVISPALYLAPLLAFDAEGGRLGYGKAYYDRIFAANPVARRVGVAFAEQAVPRVPMDARDMRLEMVLAV